MLDAIKGTKRVWTNLALSIKARKCLKMYINPLLYQYKFYFSQETVWRAVIFQKIWSWNCTRLRRQFTALRILCFLSQRSRSNCALWRRSFLFVTTKRQMSPASRGALKAEGPGRRHMFQHSCGVLSAWRCFLRSVSRFKVGTMWF